MTEKNPDICTEVKTALRKLSTQDFKNFGLHQIAYIKSVKHDTGTHYVVYSADGQELDILQTRNEAIMSARTKDLDPVILH